MLGLSGYDQALIEDAVSRVARHGRWVAGHEVGEFEKRMAQYIGVDHAVACNSGTDALVLALKAAGITRGDKVIVPAFTFQATAAAVVLAEAEPVFADVDRMFGIDPNSVAKSGAKALIAVDMFGIPANWEGIYQLCRENGLIMIEDAAQAVGSKWCGSRCGSLADIGCTSFYPSKPLAGIGDGGMVFLNDPIMAQDVRTLANHGRSPAMNPFSAIVAGMNSRLDTIQAAVLMRRLEDLETELFYRRKQAGFYRQFFGQMINFDGDECSWAWFPVVFNSKAERERALEEYRPYGAKVIYPVPLNRMAAFRRYEAKCPMAESVCERVLAMPVKHHWETNDCINYIKEKHEMKYDLPENCGINEADAKRGHMPCNETHEMDDTPPNSLWRDMDDGGFLGRPKGLER